MDNFLHRIAYTYNVSIPFSFALNIRSIRVQSPKIAYINSDNISNSLDPVRFEVNKLVN